MSIRKANSADIQEIAALYDALCDWLAGGVNYPGWQKGVYPTIDDAREGIASGDMFVFEKDSRIAAAVRLNRQQHPAYASGAWTRETPDDRVTVVHTLAVHPELSRQGIAGHVVDFAIAYARERGDAAIRLDVTDGNLPAARLYEKKGFRFVGKADLGWGRALGLPLFGLYELLLLPEKE